MRSLEKTLSDVFGFDGFRGGQKEVCEQAIEGRDVCVFWATGCGKSVAYQLPAFHLNKCVVVVSPLLSLMYDQVSKINAIAGKKVAVSLGGDIKSADMTFIESDAACRLVYVTPERTVQAHFLVILERLHSAKKLALIAIDEAHCVVSWGCDFRAEYGMLGTIRKRLPNVPLMALTATAPPTYRVEIMASLGLLNAVVSAKGVDRPNLALSVLSKSVASKRQNQFRLLLDETERNPTSSSIVYVSTRKETEDISRFLQNELDASQVSARVEAYHAGMSNENRVCIHHDFLQDRVQIIVATTAFGMGIDKPDIRRVIHFGPPSSFEEYYQQIGRAGRDGLVSQCQLIFADSEFTKYKTDFYMGHKNHRARQNSTKSLDALRSYAGNSKKCRRVLICEYFEETPDFDRCEMCDTCLDSVDGSDPTSDFTREALLVLKAVKLTSYRSFGVTKLFDMIFGKSPEMSFDADTAMLSAERLQLERPLTKKFCKELVSVLVQEGILKQDDVKINVSANYSTVYTTYMILPPGEQVLNGHKRVLIPTPKVLFEVQQQENKMIEDRERDLHESGVNISLIPRDQLFSGKGPIITAYLHWARTMSRLSLKQPERAQQLKELLDSILEWRRQAALQLRIAPSSVFMDHVARQIAYSQPTSSDALNACGIRIHSSQQLLELIQEWKSKYGESDVKRPLEQSDQVCIQLPKRFVPQHAKTEPPVGKKLPNWYLSWDQFQNHGQHPEAIALQQPSGRPLQPTTIIAHILKACENGYPVDLARLVQMDGCQVNTQEWKQLQEAFDTVGLERDRPLKDVVRCILGAMVDQEERSAEDKAKLNRWYLIARFVRELLILKVPVKF